MTTKYRMQKLAGILTEETIRLAESDSGEELDRGMVKTLIATAKANGWKQIGNDEQPWGEKGVKLTLSRNPSETWVDKVWEWEDDLDPEFMVLSYDGRYDEWTVTYDIGGSFANESFDSSDNALQRMINLGGSI